MMTLPGMSWTYLARAALLGGAGLWLSAIAWGMPLPPFRANGDRLYLIVPGQMLTLSAAASALAAFGIPLGRAAGWLSAILTHGGP